MTLTAVRDTHLHITRRGEGAPLLFLVGLGGRAEFFAAQFAAFAPSRDVLSFDHRGTGRSAAYGGAYSVKLLAEDTVALLDALGLARVDIVGHSMGGAIAQHVAAFFPERVGRLVLSASWCGPSALFIELFKLRREVLARLGPEAYLRQGTFMAHPPAWLEARFEDAEAFFADRLKAFAGVETELARIDAVMAHDLRAEVSRISARTLVLCAEDDGITPVGLSRELAERIAKARLKLLPRGGHFAPMTEPERYNAALAQFLDQPQRRPR